MGFYVKTLDVKTLVLYAVPSSLVYVSGASITIVHIVDIYAHHGIGCSKRTMRMFNLPND